MSEEDKRAEVQTFYSKTVHHVDDFKVTVCPLKCDKRNQAAKEAEILVHDKIKEKYYGCGLIAPSAIEGLRVLDLGCGAGMDCFVLAKLVGESGFITGIDMTEEQIATARQYTEYHRETFGYKAANTEFVKGILEDLTSAGIQDNSYDLIVSNCVVSLVTDKKQVLKEAHRVLKKGGEFYFSDTYSNKPVPSELQADQELWGECLSGAMCWEELHSLAQETGFSTSLLVETTDLEIQDTKMKNRLEKERLKFISATYRLFKLAKSSTEGPDCNEYSLVKYNGGIFGYPNEYELAIDFLFKTGEAMYVTSTVADILNKCRLEKYFTITKKSLMVNPFDIS